MELQHGNGCTWPNVGMPPHLYGNCVVSFYCHSLNSSTLEPKITVSGHLNTWCQFHFCQGLQWGPFRIISFLSRVSCNILNTSPSAHYFHNFPTAVPKRRPQSSLPGGQFHLPLLTCLRVPSANTSMFWTVFSPSACGQKQLGQLFRALADAPWECGEEGRRSNQNTIPRPHPWNSQARWPLPPAGQTGSSTVEVTYGTWGAHSSLLTNLEVHMVISWAVPQNLWKKTMYINVFSFTNACNIGFRQNRDWLAIEPPIWKNRPLFKWVSTKLNISFQML